MTTLGTAFYPGDFKPSLKWLDINGLANRVKQITATWTQWLTEIIAEHQAQREMEPVTEQEKDMVHTNWKSRRTTKTKSL